MFNEDDNHSQQTNENTNTNDNHSQQTNENDSHSCQPLLPFPADDNINIVSQNFSDSFSTPNNFLDENGKPKGKPGRPPGSPNKKTEVAPYYRRTQSVEDEDLLKDIFTVVFKGGLDKESFVMAALRIPRYQWLNMTNTPGSKIRETIQMAIEAYEVDMLQRGNQRIEDANRGSDLFLMEAIKRIRRKYGEADFLLQAAPSALESMTPEELEKIALEHVSKS